MIIQTISIYYTILVPYTQYEGGGMIVISVKTMDCHSLPVSSTCRRGSRGSTRRRGGGRGGGHRGGSEGEGTAYGLMLGQDGKGEGKGKGKQNDQDGNVPAAAAAKHNE